MAKTIFTVDYHLACAIYFRDRTPSAADLARAWAALAPLSHRRASTSIRCRGDKKEATFKGSAPLGSPDFSAELMTRGPRITWAGASLVRRGARNAILDSDVNFEFSRNEIWDGKTAPPSLQLSVCGPVLEEKGSEVILRILRTWFELLDSYSPICGLVDLARTDDACVGTVYGTMWPLTAPLARWIEHINWHYSAANLHDRLRGVYWGNYFGPAILKRLGGKATFVDQFGQKARSFDGTPNALSWSWTNGVFVSLCLDPLECRPNRLAGIAVAAQANLKWLIPELGTKGVLNPW